MLKIPGKKDMPILRQLAAAMRPDKSSALQQFEVLAHPSPNYPTGTQSPDVNAVRWIALAGRHQL